MRHIRLSFTFAALTFVSAPLLAQQKAAPAVRPIGAITATSNDSIMTIAALRHLSSGKVLVNDVASRRVVLLDGNLKIEKVVADTTDATAKAYGAGIGNLVAYKGDSTLYVDAQSLSMLVIDGEGNIARVMSVPRTRDAGMLGTSMLGGMGFDGERMVYRGFGGGMMRGQTITRANPGAASNGPGFTAPSMPDSTPIVRVHLASREVDTVATIKINNPRTTMSRSDSGMSVVVEINPLPTVDEYALLSDGRIAVVRGRTYHVDFIDKDGKVTEGPKIPFEWKRLSDEDKARFIDSVKAITERQSAAGGNTAAARVGAAMGAMVGGSGAGAMMGGGAPVVINSVRIAGAAGEPMSQQRTTSFRITPEVNFVSPDELPDYQPAFLGNAARGDMDGNLWVRIISPTPITGGAVYDVIDGKGELVDRVQVPEGRTIVGFGNGGVIYMTNVEDGVFKLEKASRN